MTAGILKPGVQFRSKYFTGVVTVVSTEGNDLFIIINPGEGKSSWEETWNLEHTVWGFNQHTYSFVAEYSL